jgi:hypothetical protein
MAAINFTPISLYYTTTAAAVPSAGNLVAGELALNTTDEKLYFKNAAGTVKLLASNAATAAGVDSFSAGTTGFTPSTATTGAVTLAGTLAVANGGTNASTASITSFNNITGYTASGATGTTSTNLVFSTSPTLVTPALGTPSQGVLSSCTVDGTNPVGYRNIPQSGSAKTTSYTLAVGDVGEFIEIGASGSIVVPNATFAAGDAVVIFNNTASAATLTMSITTAYIGGTNTDVATISLATRGLCNVLFISGTVCVVTGNVT